MGANKTGPLNERDAVVERLREFIRFGYVTGAEVARRIGVDDGTVYSWLLGEFKPAKTKRLIAFLDSLPAERGSGIARLATSIGSTKIGEASPNRDVVRFVRPQKAGFER
jgi:hypothetical protein